MRLFRRIKDPVEGIAQVVSATQWTSGSWQNCEMTLVVQAIGVEPFTLRHKCMARADKWPYAGHQLPVTFDRKHTDRLDVQWDRVQSAKDRSMEQAEAMRDALASGQRQPQVPGQNIQVQTQVIDLSDNPEARDAIIDAVEKATGQDVDGDGRVGS